MIKVVVITDFCDLQHACRKSLEDFQRGGNNYSDYITFVDDVEKATHAIIINRATPKLNIPKENIIGIAWEPNENLRDLNFDYIEKNISLYLIGNIKKEFPPNFISYYSFMWALYRYRYWQNILPEKKKVLSIIVSDKNRHKGHKLRWKLVKKILKSDLDIDIYGTGCRFIKKDDRRIKGEFHDDTPFSDYLFSVAIENTKHSDYISEKFTNCLAMNAIPVYWGGENVERYFGSNCCHKLSSSTGKNMKLLSDICNNHEDYLIDLSCARKNLYEGNAYLVKFLYDLWVNKRPLS